ncbi:precorrin-6Y C5,15-methyltransferase (decarboxylating) subunit CbiT [Clostridium sp. CS001]|uniref:precorrin-6Y C5,15-methyltransferase (decarboxylating) subunit CbiT n=1 Tax=Clostridium sp. CS001 TaxID=2880648 RepID=UPI001CF159E0|nr:precorrin-6Y C5,15-methyltransferase (decarboxylating) subunit CbiT [Clostridium sp. CS001]MCB2290701.1 precorrin-6Y C5,15-methyltransferase (decarboxylating) subunit CbiT [Clostridium sp. CS001]
MRFIKDHEFIRGNCPMTKEEVRILSIAKLELEEEYRVLDIGAGTGSVSIQMAKICEKGEVIAIEKDEEALEIIKQNKEKFKANNLEIISAEAMEIESDITGEFDAIFVGGSGGNIAEIIITYGSKLKKDKNIVLNFITINNLYKAMEALKSLNYEVECVQLQVSKTKGQSYMLMGNNPIFIVSGKKGSQLNYV